jgi:predicted pyridoxine 5'-phosphate oxidase superfamily flavin-nucleotide-binding protein
MKFHRGEVAVQEKMGVREMAERIGNGIHSQIPATAQRWLRDQRLAAATTVAPHGSVWVSLLTGEAGFLEPVDENTLHLNLAPVDELLQTNLAANEALGLIVLEPATRRRMRLNGTARCDDTGLLISARQVYSNCPKYIQARHIIGAGPVEVAEVQTGNVLMARQIQWIERADTFFIGSLHDGNADSSHRGGNPSFVQVENGSCLRWPEYSGNAMFNTLGNLQQNARCGLLFVDWESDRALQLSGVAHLQHGASTVSVEFQLERWRETVHASALRWQFSEFSPFNPAV